MEKYYGVKFQGLKFYICPQCQILSTGTFAEFLNQHGEHLDMFTIPKKAILEDYKEMVTLAKQFAQNKNKVSPPVVQPVAQPSDVQSVSQSSSAVPSTPIRKRKTTQTNVPAKKLRLSCESVIGNNYLNLCFDVAPDNFISTLPPDHILDSLHTFTSRFTSCKVQYGLEILFENDEGDFKQAYISHLAVPYENLFPDFLPDKLREKIESFAEMGSGWKLVKILKYWFHIVRTNSLPYLSGRSYLPTPTALLHSMAIVNVQNEDHLCFLYSILAVTKYSEINKHRYRVSNYAPYLSELTYSLDDMPMRICNISQFERNNPHLSINVFLFHDEDDIDLDEDIIKNPFVDILYRSKNSNGTVVNLMIIEKNDCYHYVAVPNINRLLNIRSNVRRIQCKHWCKRCLHGFRLDTAYFKHLPLCQSSYSLTTLYKMPENKYCEFKDWSKSISPPFVVYADFESVLCPNDKVKHIHMPAAGLLIVSTSDCKYGQFVGENCIVEFLAALEDIVRNVVAPWYENKPMIPLTSTEWYQFKHATACYLCKEIGTAFVRDHCHITGKYLGPACNKCNLSRKIRHNLPVIFHNLRGYDLHHILKHALSKFSSWELNVIQQTTEKFLTMQANIRCSSKTVSIRFIDSLQFLPASLKTLASNLDSFPLTETAFPSDVIKGKGIFPYTVAQ